MLTPVPTQQRVRASLAQPQQARSQIGLLKMLHAGRELIEECGNLADLSVADIVERSGTSTGAFYRRFESKEKFFDVVQEQVMRSSVNQVREMMMNDSEWQLGDARSIADAVVQMYVRAFRRNRGLYHASLIRGSRPGTAWDPVKEANREALTLVAPPLVAALVRERGVPDRQIGTVEFEVHSVVQMIVGMLVNIVLNDPGPLSLNDRRLPSWLQIRFRRCLNLDNINFSERGQDLRGKLRERVT